MENRKDILQFIKGQWLVREWSKECGGEVDFIRFENIINDKEFSYSKFYRIKNGKALNLYDKGLLNYPTPYYDNRMSIQVRPATELEIQKYAVLIIMSGKF